MTYDDEIRLAELIRSLQTLLLSNTDMKTFLEGVAAVAGSVVDPPASCEITAIVDGRPTTVATTDPGGAEVGVRSSLSIPIRTADGRMLGAVDIYGYDRPREFGEGERERLQSFADQAAVVLALALQREELQQLTVQLEHALVSRSVIDQAIGILMAQERCDADAAFDLLRRHSQNHNRKLRDVAADFLARFAELRSADGSGAGRPDDLAPA